MDKEEHQFAVDVEHDRALAHQRKRQDEQVKLLLDQCGYGQSFELNGQRVDPARVLQPGGDRTQSEILGENLFDNACRRLP